MIPASREHVSDPGEGVKGGDLSGKQWTTLNRLRTGVGRYRSSMKKWGLACECGKPEQKADHITDVIHWETIVTKVHSQTII